MPHQNEPMHFVEKETMAAKITIGLYKTPTRSPIEPLLHGEETSLKPLFEMEYMMPISIGPFLFASDVESATQDVVDCKYYRPVSMAYAHLPKEDQRKLHGRPAMRLGVVGARLAFELYAAKHYDLNKIHIPYHATNLDSTGSTDVGYQFLVEKLDHETEEKKTISEMVKNGNTMKEFRLNEETLRAR